MTSFLIVANIFCYYHSTACQWSFCLYKLTEYPKYCSRLLLSPGLLHNSATNKFPGLIFGLDWHLSPTVASLWQVPLRGSSGTQNLSSCSSKAELQHCAEPWEPPAVAFPWNQPQKGFGKLQDGWLSRAADICPQSWSRMSWRRNPPFRMDCSGTAADRWVLQLSNTDLPQAVHCCSQY